MAEEESAASTPTPPAPGIDPFQTAIGDPWNAGALSTPVQPSMELSRSPKAETLGEEFRRKLEALTSPTQVRETELDEAVATTTPTKDEFMRRLRMIEMRHESSENSETPRDIESHDRQSRSVAGSLLHAEEEAVSETQRERVCAKEKMEDDQLVAAVERRHVRGAVVAGFGKKKGSKTTENCFCPKIRFR